MKAFRALFRSEFVLALRDMNLPIFGIAFPVIVALAIGLITGNKPVEGAVYGFVDQSFGAFAAISICATGLMGLPLILSDYRHKKILKRFMVTPVSPGVLLLVQGVINVVYCAISFFLLYGMCALFWGYRMAGNAGVFLLCYLLTVCAIYSLGMMLASVARDVKSANILCSLLYFPMLFFSGATIPYEIMPKGAQMVMDILPLTQGIKLLKTAALGLQMEGAFLSILILAVVTVVCTVLSIRFFRWE